MYKKKISCNITMTLKHKKYLCNIKINGADSKTNKKCSPNIPVEMYLSSAVLHCNLGIMVRLNFYQLSSSISAYHLYKPWANRFLHVNGKQPLSWVSCYPRVLNRKYFPCFFNETRNSVGKRFAGWPAFPQFFSYSPKCYPISNTRQF